MERETGKTGNERREFSETHPEGSAGGDPGLLGVKVPFSLPPEHRLELPEPLPAGARRHRRARIAGANYPANWEAVPPLPGPRSPPLVLRRAAAF